MMSRIKFDGRGSAVISVSAGEFEVLIVVIGPTWAFDHHKRLLWFLGMSSAEFHERLLDPGKHGLFPEHFKRLEQWRRILSSTYRHPDRLKHLARLDTEFLRRGT